MTKDFLLGLAWGLLLALFLIWLFDRTSPETTPPDKARQGVPGEQWGDLNEDERELLRRAK